MVTQVNVVKAPRHPFRRFVLGAAAAAALAAPAIASGCGGTFAPISQVNALRVLAVVADKPYAAPGEDVTFHMTSYDGLVDPNDPNAPARNVQILWLGGCFDPEGDQYYGCYASLAEAFKGLQSGGPLPPGLIGVGESFKITLPMDIISRRPAPPVGPHYGLAYVFFAACAGTLKPVPADGTGRAGSFPLGCFDENDNELGADSFVPGYTQIYSFEDERPNTNPVVNTVTFDGKPVAEGLDDETTIDLCDVADDKRSAPPSCGQKDPLTDCKVLEIDVDVPSDVAEADPEAKAPDGKPLHEVVWVDYFAEKGTFDGDIKLVSDATTGVTKNHMTNWIPPAEPGRVSLWAVVHDARGGGTVQQRFVLVK